MSERMNVGKKVSIYFPNDVTLMLDEIQDKKSLSNTVSDALKFAYSFYFEEVKISIPAIIALKHDFKDVLQTTVEEDGVVYVYVDPKRCSELTLNQIFNDYRLYLMHLDEFAQMDDTNNYDYVLHCCEMPAGIVQSDTYSTLGSVREAMQARAVFYKNAKKSQNVKLLKESNFEDNIKSCDKYVLTFNDGDSVMMHVAPVRRYTTQKIASKLDAYADLLNKQSDESMITILSKEQCLDDIKIRRQDESV